MAIESVALDAHPDLDTDPDPLSDSSLIRELIEGSHDALAPGLRSCAESGGEAASGDAR